jgi:hypothetical protein
MESKLAVQTDTTANDSKIAISLASVGMLNKNFIVVIKTTDYEDGEYLMYYDGS